MNLSSVQNREYRFRVGAALWFAAGASVGEREECSFHVFGESLTESLNEVWWPQWSEEFLLRHIVFTADFASEDESSRRCAHAPLLDAFCENRRAIIAAACSILASSAGPM